MKAMFNNGMRSAGVMLLFTLGFTALMAGAHLLTRDTVLRNEEKSKAALIAQVLPTGSYDNDLLANRQKLSVADAQILGNSGESFYYPARKAGKTQGVVIETTALEGYAGKISLLVGIGADGRVLGVRVVSHKETPGLGDYIDAAKSDWIKMFTGKSLASPTPERWKVKKDGGDFDYTAGATISPRAVVKAVQIALNYAAEHRATLFK